MVLTIKICIVLGKNRLVGVFGVEINDLLQLIKHIEGVSYSHIRQIPYGFIAILCIVEHNGSTPNGSLRSLLCCIKEQLSSITISIYLKKGIRSMML